MSLEFNENDTPTRNFSTGKKEGSVMRLIKKTGLAKTDKQANTVALVMIGVLAIITLLALTSL